LAREECVCVRGLLAASEAAALLRDRELPREGLASSLVRDTASTVLKMAAMDVATSCRHVLGEAEARDLADELTRAAKALDEGRDEEAREAAEAFKEKLSDALDRCIHSRHY